VSCCDCAWVRLLSGLPGSMGSHPRSGFLDVVPVPPQRSPMSFPKMQWACHRASSGGPVTYTRFWVGLRLGTATFVFSGTFVSHAVMQQRPCFCPCISTTLSQLSPEKISSHVTGPPPRGPVTWRSSDERRCLGVAVSGCVDLCGVREINHQ